MNHQNAEPSTGRTGTLVIASLFVLIGVITLYDTTTYSDLDAKVFPRAASIVLIVSAISIIIANLLRPLKEPGFGQCAWWRRVLLVVCMLVAALVMPEAGFLPAASIAFFGAMVAAMHERWTLRTLGLYVGSAVVIMVAFYTFFRFILNVPLP